MVDKMRRRVVELREGLIAVTSSPALPPDESTTSCGAPARESRGDEGTPN